MYNVLSFSRGQDGAVYWNSDNKATGCLAEISAETEIKDNFSAEIKYSAELFELFGSL